MNTVNTGTTEKMVVPSMIFLALTEKEDPQTCIAQSIGIRENTTVLL